MDILLNNTTIHADNFKEEINNGLHKIFIDFNVASEDYHDIAVLLYEGSFDVKVPEKGLAFRGKIVQYSTSVTNLYEQGQTGQYSLCLQEVAGKEG